MNMHPFVRSLQVVKFTNASFHILCQLMMNLILDNESDQAEAITKENPAKQFCCDYGLCDFQQILFNTISDP